MISLMDIQGIGGSNCELIYVAPNVKDLNDEYQMQWAFYATFSPSGIFLLVNLSFS